MAEDPEEQQAPGASPDEVDVARASGVADGQPHGGHGSDALASDAEGSDGAVPGPGDDDAHDAALEAMTELLREQARGWGRQIRLMLQLDVLTAPVWRPGVRSSRSWRWPGRGTSPSSP